MCLQGSHASWKVLQFLLENFQDLKSPGKWPWSLKVLEIYLRGPGKSWTLLANDADGKRNDADTDAKIWHKFVLTYAVSVFTIH